MAAFIMHCNSVYCLPLILDSKSPGCSRHVELCSLSIKLLEIWKLCILTFVCVCVKLDVLPEQIKYQLHNTDFQESPYCQYSTVQFPPALQSVFTKSFQYLLFGSTVQWWRVLTVSCELSKSICVVAHHAEDGYPGIKRSRITHSSIWVKGQEELCAVCGDKASGYHYI